jgi:hypothetical protein
VTATIHRKPGRRTKVRRPGTIYGYRTRCVHSSGLPDTGTEQAYVGQTRQQLADRDGQHRGQRPQRDGTVDCQPWSDLIGGGIYVVEQGLWDDDEIDVREQYWIARLRPRYNVVHGVDGRIPKYVARRHRDARDLARGLTPRDWAPCRPDARRSQLPLKWRRRRNTTLAWSGGWLAFSLALWAVLAVAGRHAEVAWQVWPILSGAVCGVPVGVKVRSVWRRSRVRRTLRKFV